MEKTKDLKTIYALKNYKVDKLSHLICHTNAGPLEISIRKDENEYYITLDSVPVDKELNRELLKLYGI